MGHLPSGYIASKLLFPRFESSGVSRKPFFWAGIFGSVAPDLDMAYFYFVDHRRHLHHTYWTHFPIVWAGLLLISLVWFRASSGGRKGAISTIFTLCGFIHLLLDSIVGNIWWFAPFIDRPFTLFSVPALYRPWWLNFLLNWSFALELVIVAWAVYIWRKGYVAERENFTVTLEHQRGES